MKHIVIFALVALFSTTASAQDACPEFANMVNAVIDGGTKGKELGMEKPVAKQRKKGIYRGHDMSIRFEGKTAKVSVATSPAFAFKPINPNIHPAQQIMLYPFNTKKDFRELVVGGTNMWGGSKNRKADDNSIGLSFEKIKDGCYKVAPDGELPKGEYAFSLSSVGQGSSADVKGTNAGWGTSVQGQVWFGFSVK